MPTKSESAKKPADKKPSELQAQVPSAAVLQQYLHVSPELPALVMKEWGYRHKRQFLYAMVSLIIGGLVAFSLIGGFVFLVMNGHPKEAGWLLGSGAVGLVSGFVASRF